MGWRAEIEANGRKFSVDGGGPQTSLSGVELTGWWSTPDGKWSLTERAAGDGAFDVADDSILYSARTVELSMWAVGGRSDQIDQMRAVLATAHNVVKLRVIDDASDTYVTGLATVSDDAGSVLSDHQGITLTLSCPDPRRLSTAAHTKVLTPTSSTTRGGLMFGPDGTGGLLLPIQFSKVASTLNNYGTVVNNGTSRAYPTIKVNGVFSGLSINIITPERGTSTITYSGYVGAVPLVLDFKDRTAYIDSLDTSKYLTSRGFQSIQPGSSMGVTLTTTGSGYITVSVNDTYL